MNKICTSIEQSQKLIDLGIDIDTADMFWKNGVSDKYIQCFTPFVSCGTNMDYDYDIPAWSLDALLSVLPKGTRLLKSATGDTYHCDCPKGNIDKWFDNSIDAAFEMVCWLKENKKI